MIDANWWIVVPTWFIISFIVSSVYVWISKGQDIDDVVLRAIITFILWPFYLVLGVGLFIPGVVLFLSMQYFEWLAKKRKRK